MFSDTDRKRNGCDTDRKKSIVIDWDEIDRKNQEKVPWIFYEIERSTNKIMEDGHYLSKFCRYYQVIKEASEYACQMRVIKDDVKLLNSLYLQTN